MTDPIADLLTRIRNAAAVNKKTVDVPYSKLKQAIANILKDEGYVEEVAKVEPENQHPSIHITLKYKGANSVITQINRVSKPGRRVYIKSDEIKPTLSGYGTKIISTSQGVMTSNAARAKNVGGEVLCEIW